MRSAAVPAAVEGILRRDRAIVAAGLAVITALSWAYLLHSASGMAGMNTAARMGERVLMPRMEAWGPAELLGLLVMWSVMMVAMMVPSAAPSVLTFARLQRHRELRQRPVAPTGVFLAGYLIVWTGFSLLAALGQWGLHAAGVHSARMSLTSPYVSAAVLAAAGLYQLTALKGSCLRHCRSPVNFLAAHWMEGRGGALAMGLHHGLYCVACCWLLMLILFVTGVMNLLWVAIIAAFVLLEKSAMAALAPWISRAAGAALLTWAGLLPLLA